jgi:dCTP deaminase
VTPPGVGTLDEVCETSYKDRGGKYQGQRGVTLPKT